MTLSAVPRRIFAVQPKISRLEAFAEQGVSLAYPARSWSGVREDNGGVVIAIREGEVQSAFDGFRCLLWSPVIEGATQWVDRPIKQERLSHCRLAWTFGGADGLIVRGVAAEVDRDTLVPLRVEKVGAEYWAFWGTATCVPQLASIRRGDIALNYERERIAA